MTKTIKEIIIHEHYDIISDIRGVIKTKKIYIPIHKEINQTIKTGLFNKKERIIHNYTLYRFIIKLDDVYQLSGYSFNLVDLFNEKRYTSYLSFDTEEEADIESKNI